MKEEQIKEPVAESANTQADNNTIDNISNVKESEPSVAESTMSKNDEVKALLTQEIKDATAVLTDDFIAILAYAKEHCPNDYLGFKMRAKAAKIPLRDLDNAVTQCLKKSKGENGDGEQLLELGRTDLNGAVAPKGWSVTLEGGVQKIILTRNGESTIIACPDAVIITAYLFNADNDKERMELSFYRNNDWKKITGSRAQISNRATLIPLSDYGLRVSSESARDFIIYIQDYERTNSKVIPNKKSLARIGWIEQNRFYPFAVDEDIVYEENEGANVFHGLKEQGDYIKWKDMTRKLRKNLYSRFISNASFASPLLVPMGVRPFVIHIWHDSASGKSAALKGAISVWGNPQKLMVTGNTTNVGIEMRAGILNNLPLGIDEKQATDESKTSLSKIIYMLGQGEGRTRGAKCGGNQETPTWCNVTIITGEEPITSSSSNDGVQTRTLEINGRPIDDIEFAQEVHKTSESNYGFAGAEFIRTICARLKSEPDFLTKMYDKTHDALKAAGLKGVHTEYIAAIVVADYLVETIIFDTDAATAEKESFDAGVAIFKHNEEQLHSDNITTAYDFIVSWIASNENRFQEKDFNDTFVPSPCFGKKVSGEYRTTYYVVPHILEQTLQEKNYNPEKIMRGCADRGYIFTSVENTKDGEKRRKKCRTMFNGVRTEMYRFDLIKKDPPPHQIGLEELKPVEDDKKLSF